MARKSKTADHFVKALNPRDSNPHSGEEPFFGVQPNPDFRTSALAKGFSWYNTYYGKKEAKELLTGYLEHNDRAQDAKLVRKVADGEISMTMGWLARMTLRGLELNEPEQIRLNEHIKHLIKTLDDTEVKSSQTGGKAKVKVDKEEVNNRPNIQEIMREKASLAAGELEGMFDDYIKEGAKTNHKFRPMDELTRANIMPQHVNIVTDAWKMKLSEFEELQEGQDKQLNEAYSHLSKQQVKNIIKFIEQVLGDCNSYITIKKTSKTPRKRKPVPVEKLVRNLKYLKEFKDASQKLDLISIHPTKIHGATEAWVYDTAKRKLHHYVADEYSKCFTVKGNTLLGFDSKESEIKTLRKPAEQLKEVMGSKPAARKYFNSIKAVATTPKGRFNSDMIILKAF
jgi:hypothetical protein